MTYNYISLVWASIHCESKMEKKKKKIYKLSKVDDRILVPQLDPAVKKTPKI